MDVKKKKTLFIVAFLVLLVCAAAACFLLPWMDIYESLKTDALEYGVWGVFVLVFLHAGIIPLPTTLPLVFFCTMHPEQSLEYGIAAIAGAMLSYIVNYAAGYYAGKPILRWFGKEEQVGRFHERLKKYELWTVMFAGLIPMPFVLFTIACGLLRVTFYKFVLGCLFSRIIKTGVIVFLFFTYSDEVEWVKRFVERELPGYSGAIAAALLIAGAVLLLYYRRRNSKKTRNGDKDACSSC